MSGANSGSASDDNTNFMQFMSLGSQDFLAARVSGCENDIAPASETKEVQELKKNQTCGWWFGTSILFSHILGIIIPID